MAKNIPRNEIAYNPDQDEAEQGQVILEEKNKKRVRYWWEEGYVPGNEKDSEDEGSSDGDAKTAESSKQLEDDEEDLLEDSYEAIAPGDARGGSFVRWGGLSGRLCLADGDLGLEDGDASTLEAPAAPIQDYLDELLMPVADIQEEEACAETATRLALENSPPAAAETTAIVLYQTPASRVRPWSFCTITERFSEVDASEVRKVFAIEDAKRNHRLYSEEMQALSQVAVGNYLLRQQQGFEVVQKAKEDEAIRRRNVKEGAKERLPGTKQPLAVSKAWQEHLAGQPSVEVPGQAEAREPRPAKLRTRRTLLPGSLSASSSSGPARLPVKQIPKEQRPWQKLQASAYHGFDDADFEPNFLVPEMPRLRVYTPSNPDEMPL
ncbi:unnamed protein product [Effrenium voratum]|nr:unnamed protein product [Effrenium voratum]